LKKVKVVRQRLISLFDFLLFFCLTAAE